jgi:hypothetical protein
MRMSMQHQFNTLSLKDAAQGPAICKAFAPTQGFSQGWMMNQQHPEELACSRLSQHPVQGLQLCLPQIPSGQQGY